MYRMMPQTALRLRETSTATVMLLLRGGETLVFGELHYKFLYRKYITRA